MTHTIRLLLVVLLAGLALPLVTRTFAGQDGVPSLPASEDVARLLAEAEHLRAEGSFALALEAYRRLEAEALESDTRAWVRMRAADSDWRAAAATEDPDPTRLDAALAALKEQLAELDRPEERGRLFAELSESLGDFHWTGRRGQEWFRAWQGYEAALAYWAAETDIELARRRYLDLVWRITEGGRGAGYWRGEFQQRAYNLPASVLENAVRIAQRPYERSRAHLLLALHLDRSYLDSRNHRRTAEAFAEAIEHGAGTPWLDDALWYYGRWLESKGRLVLEPGRPLRTEPDFVAALVPYRRILSDFTGGEARWRAEAGKRIAEITGSTVTVRVDQAFLPGSIVRYDLGWRNVERIELALYRVDPLQHVQPDTAPREARTGGWIDYLQSGELEAVRRWEHAGTVPLQHAPGSAPLRLEKPLEPGAYLLIASANGNASRALVLVSSGALVVKGAAGEVLAWFTDVETSAPIANEPVRLWEARHSNESDWLAHDGRTDDDGLVRFRLRPGTDWRSVWLLGGSGAHTTFSAGSSQGDPDESVSWRVQAHTDRSAYRPGQTVQWKLVARERRDGVYTTPAGRTVRVELRDPRGEVHSERTVTLNDFGTGWSTFEFGASDALGLYTAQFSVEAAGDLPGAHLGSQTFARLEEYRLPEFRVSVAPTTDEDGGARLFRLGESVEAEVRAEYYFGGPVAGAEVEVLVHQRPYWRPPTVRSEYAWLLQPDRHSMRWWGGAGQLVLRQELVTDAEGRASFSFPTPAGANQDYEYTVEARVTDLSRREVTGSGTVRVTQRAYHIDARVERRVVRPGTSVPAIFEVTDANGRPVETTGHASLVRRRWVEVWVDPQGRRVEGEALHSVKERAGHFPPPPGSDLPPWRPIRQEWVEELVTSTTLVTDAEGRVTWDVRPPNAGYYEVVWRGEDRWGERIEARASLWAATEDRLDLGYVRDGVSVVVDRDSFRSGETAPVLVVVDASNRYVLFTVQADRLLDAQVLHVRGDAKLVELELDERHVPDIHLAATTFLGGEMRTDSTRVLVPPVEHFLDIEVNVEPAEVRPGETGTLSVRTTDVDGEPVAAEVSIALVDRSVAAIQEDLSVDPRQFFFGDLRGDHVQTLAMVGGLRRVRWVANEQGELRDERQAALDTSEVDLEGFGASTGVPSPSSRREGAMRGLGIPQEESAKLGRLQDLGYLGVEAEMQSAAPGGGGGGSAEITVRVDFRETAAWEPALVTDEDGRASLVVKFPSSLTEWDARARAVDHGSRVGQGNGEARTRQPLVVRVQAPRFFVVGDTCLVSMNVTNRTEGSLTVTPMLEASGVRMLGFVDGDELRTGAVKSVELAAGEDRRFDWRVVAEAPGEARFVGKATAGEHSDGVERTYPVVPYGLEVLIARSGRVADAGVVSSFDLPAERADGTTEVVVQVAPNLALTMLDALPYLIEFPYGCTEQTLSRFLPAVVVKRTLTELGLDPALVAARSFGGITDGAAEHVMRETKATLAQLDEVVQRGLERLGAMQPSSGGWGWWSGSREDLFMSGYAVFGLSLAREAGAPVDAEVLDRGARFLDERLVAAEEDHELRAWMLHALATYLASSGDVAIELKHTRRAADELFEARARLGSYGQALLLRALVELDGDRAQIDVLARNLRNGVLLDNEPDASLVPVGGQSASGAHPRAHWGARGRTFYWWGDSVETTAFALWALLDAGADDELCEQAVEWLIKNRRGAQWKNTRDTAITVLALDRYIRARGLLERPVAFEVRVNGSPLASEELSGDELLKAPLRYTVPAELLRVGENRVELLRPGGDGPLWFSIEARFFSEEKPIPARGSELFVRRTYLELEPRPTLLAGPRLFRVPLLDGESITSGRRVEVVHLVEAKTPLEYLVFEDLKPAGFEAVGVKSGEPLHARRLTRDEVELRIGAGEAEYPARLAEILDAGGAGTTHETVQLHQELRDRHVAYFADKLPAGFWEIRYELRAETPGEFQALPLAGWAMYVPEVRGNGTGLTVGVVERETRAE